MIIRSQGIDDFGQITTEEFIKDVQGQSYTVIGNPALREIVGPDAFRPVARSDLVAAMRRPFGVAPGAFLISAEKRSHEVDYVLVRSLAGGPLRLENPWPQRQVDVTDLNGQPVEVLQGAVLEISTLPQEEVLIIPAGQDPATIPLVDFALD